MGKQVYKAWLATAKRKGTGIAIVEADGQKVTFKDLQDQVDQRLAESPGSTEWKNRIVALQIDNSSKWIAAFLACQAMEAIVLPFDTDVPPDGLQSVLAALHPVALWTSEGIEHLRGTSRRAPGCLIKLTSGSTGLPKPLFFDDAQMLADGRQVASTMGIRSTDVNLALIPFGHSYGLGNLVMPLIQLGTRIAVCQDPFPHSVARSIKASGATIMPAVPAILNGLARAGIDKKEVDSVRIWISAGSPLAPEDARRFQNAFGALIHNFYGSSETGGIAYDRTGKETLSGRSVGAPMNGISVRVSASGRLRVASPAVFRRGNPRRSGELGAHLLADLASLLDDGNIALLGRQTRMVKMAGKRLNLSEIERQLLMVGGINSARVVDFVTPAGRTRLAAAYAPALEMDKVRKVLKKVLPGWKIPEKWLPLPALPLTSRGKVNYRQLDAQLRQ